MVIGFEIMIVKVIAVLLSLPVAFVIIVLFVRRQKRNWPQSILAAIIFAIMAVIVNLSVLVTHPESFQEVFFEDVVWWLLSMLSVSLSLHFLEKKNTSH